jgi:mycothiol system anti-sigma-R factor
MGKECREAIEVLYEYIDGELTEDRRLLIRRHLDDCPPCVDAFEFETELRVVISQKCRDHVPDQLRLRIAQAIAELES